MQRVVRAPLTRERHMQRFHSAIGPGCRHQLSEDLSAENPVRALVSHRKNGAAVAVPAEVEHGAELIDVHRVLLAARAVAASSNFLTLPEGVIGRESMKCHAVGVFWRARPAVCRCAASSPTETCPRAGGATKATGISPTRGSGPGTTAAWRPAGCAARRSSMSRAENFS